jgi:hypothetical protein
VKLVEKHPELAAITPIAGSDRKTAEAYKAAFDKIEQEATAAPEEDEEPARVL